MKVMLESRGVRVKTEQLVPPNGIWIADPRTFSSQRGIAMPPDTVFHTCSVCSKREPWSDKWSRYCSIADEENGVPLLKFCSDDCARRIPQHKMAGIVNAALGKAGTNRAQAMRHGYSGPRVIELEVDL